MATRPALPRTVWILGVVSLLMDLSSEIYHALLPAFLTVTLGLPVAAMGALDGVAEATASMAKLASGRLSDRGQKRKPWILLGYGMAALSKPLFPLAQGALPVLGARRLRLRHAVGSCELRCSGPTFSCHVMSSSSPPSLF